MGGSGPPTMEIYPINYMYPLLLPLSLPPSLPPSLFPCPSYSLPSSTRPLLSCPFVLTLNVGSSNVAATLRIRCLNMGNDQNWYLSSLSFFLSSFFSFSFFLFFLFFFFCLFYLFKKDKNVNVCIGMGTAPWNLGVKSAWRVLSVLDILLSPPSLLHSSFFLSPSSSLLLPLSFSLSPPSPYSYLSMDVLVSSLTVLYIK